MHRVVLGAAVCVWVAGAAWWLGHGETHDASERPAPASGLPALQIAGHHRWTACPGGQRSPPPTPVLEIVGIGNGGLPGCGDGPGLTTVTPGLADDRATVTLRYTLTAPGTVRTEVCANRLSGLAPVWSRTQQAGAGMHAVSWRVPPSTGTGTYAVSVSATTSSGTATIGPCLTGGADRRGAVVRVVGIDAAFARRSYRPGQVARLSVTARASTIDAAMYLTGGGSQGGNDIGARQMVGAPVTTTTRIAWGSPDRVRRSTVALRLPAELQSGLYDVRLSAHGQVGYAPLVVRSPQPGATRIAVVAPTNTWAAYNFADPDGDGLANTWYAGSLGTSTVQLGLPFINGGAPPQWYRTDFLAWLATHGLHPDLLTDDDLEAIPNERRLAETYSAIIFAGHEEYVTAHEYDLIDGYRDLGEASRSCRPTAFSGASTARAPGCAGSLNGVTWAGQKEPWSACSTSQTTRGSTAVPTASTTSTRRRGSSGAPACTTGRPSARSASSSTCSGRHRLPRPRCSPGSTRTCQAARCEAT